MAERDEIQEMADRLFELAGMKSGARISHRYLSTRRLTGTQDGTVAIVGNRDGLLMFAAQLLKLADQPGGHWHYDEHSNLHDDPEVHLETRHEPDPWGTET
ncbi:hypothetical protein HJD18_13595 [Thermoleophilia bacterium SCSIO 60948]|nr:hypothetical protein HJD18_13595 [Thermoleophilia bacterium SCSIO 60948]